MENPEIEHSHHHTGRSRVDLVLGISAISISLISLFLAIQNDKAMEHLVQANSLPLVQVTYSTVNLDGSPHVHMDIANKGVGPATIESLELFYQGKQLDGAVGVNDALLNRTTSLEQRHVLSSDVVNSVVSGKETIPFLDFVRGAPYSDEDYAALRDGIAHVHFKVCYCSVFDECWAIQTSAPRPARIKACPVQSHSN